MRHLAEQFRREVLADALAANDLGLIAPVDDWQAEITGRSEADREAALKSAERRIRKNLNHSDRVNVATMPGELKAQIVAVYRSGLNICRTAKELHVSTLRVSAVLREAGIRLTLGPKPKYGQSRVEAGCAVCGKTFEASAWDRHHGCDLYCSRKCANEGRRRKALARGRRAGQWITCPCGQRRWSWNSALKAGLGLYCSLSCASRYGRAMARERKANT